MKDRVPITVVMITLNEEFHLADAIENVKDWAEEIFIVDSCSTDRTVDIALEHGVTIVQRPFTNFGDQWNFAIQKMPIKTPWTFKLDPDERLTPELKDEIRTLLQGEPEHCGYRIGFRLWFMGKPLHAYFNPVLRLWRTRRCRFSDVEVNEHLIVDGTEGKLKQIMEHFDSQHLHHWYEKQNKYSTMEALMRFRGDALAETPKLFGSWLQRRMWLKKFFFRLPFRYQFLYLYQLFGCGVWRDGKVGRIWARLRVEHKRIQEYKLQEMQWSDKEYSLQKSTRLLQFDSRIISSNLQKRLLPETVIGGD